MKIVAISDTHEQEESVFIPECDVLLHAGDFTYLGKLDKIEKFNTWCQKLLDNGTVKKKIVVIAGNHDLTFDGQSQRKSVRDDALREQAESLMTACAYLNQSSIEIDGVKIYGEPRQPWFHDWGFNVARDQMETECWSKVPADIDILITHGPPFQAGDKCEDGREVGCPKLREWITKHQPKLVIAGHIHESRGVYRIHDTYVVNASSCTLQYKPANPAYVIDFDETTKNVDWIKNSF